MKNLSSHAGKIILLLIFFIFVGIWSVYIELLIRNNEVEKTKLFEERKLCTEQINRVIKQQEKDKEELSMSGIMMTYSVRGCYSRYFKTCVARVDRDLSLAFTDEGRAFVETGKPYQHQMIDLLNGDNLMEWYSSKNIEHTELDIGFRSYGDLLRTLYMADCSDGQDLSDGNGKYYLDKYNATWQRKK